MYLIVRPISSSNYRDGMATETPPLGPRLLRVLREEMDLHKPQNRGIPCSAVRSLMRQTPRVPEPTEATDVDGSEFMDGVRCIRSMVHSKQR